MSLSGNLGFVPIDEVLRLLTRSNQQGAVEVTGNGLRGRVFVGRGGVDLATTSTDSELHRHLVNSGVAEESVLRRIISGETTLAALSEADQAMIDLLREMSVESLFQISRTGDEFEVNENLTSPYASPKSFDLEALLADARDREKEWDKVTEVVPDLTGPISLRRDLGQRDEVTVRADDWKLLSEIGAGSSVSEIADRLGTTRFWTARIAARLAKSELIELSARATDDSADSFDDVDEYAETIPAQPATYEQPSSEQQPVLDEGDRADSPVVPVAEPLDQSATVDQTADVDHQARFDPEDVDHDESWWSEPAEDQVEVASQSDETPPADHSNEVEEDTEAFLEKVFSELESPDSEAEEGHGLLRRRRMGSLRDFSSDS